MPSKLRGSDRALMAVPAAILLKFESGLIPAIELVQLRLAFGTRSIEEIF